MMGKRALIYFILILALHISFCSCSKISSNLLIITYEPLQLNLTFSNSVPLPKFQLLFNDIQIQYEVEKNAEISKYFIINGITEGIVDPTYYKTQRYILIFRQPLKIGDGNLDLGSFILRAHQPDINNSETKISTSLVTYYKYQNFSDVLNILAIIIVCIVYFLAYTTIIGIHCYNFLAIYIFICLHSNINIYTALDYRIAFYLLFEVNQIGQSETIRFIYICMPHLMIIFSFLIGILCRFTLIRFANRSKLANIIYYYLSYRLLIITWDIMCVPILVNLHQLISGGFYFQQMSKWLVYGYIYFSIVLIGFYSYMAYFTVNPQINQSGEKWATYIQTGHFKLFQGFHLKIDAKNWKKRNFLFIVSIMRMLIIIFISFKFINAPNLLLQFSYLIYLFTLRPFKYDFFNYCIIGIQVFVILFYLYRYVVQLYVGISEQIITSTDIAKILLSNIVAVCVIIFTYFLLALYQFYQRMLVFKTNIIMTWIQKANQSTKTNETVTENTKQEQQMPQKRLQPKKSLRKLRRGISINKELHSSPKLKVLSSEPFDNSNESDKVKTKLTGSYQSQHSPVSISKQKSSRKIKQKSSLLQTISMSQQNS